MCAVRQHNGHPLVDGAASWKRQKDLAAEIAALIADYKKQLEQVAKYEFVPRLLRADSMIVRKLDTFANELQALHTHVQTFQCGLGMLSHFQNYNFRENSTTAPSFVLNSRSNLRIALSSNHSNLRLRLELSHPLPY